MVFPGYGYSGNGKEVGNMAGFTIGNFGLFGGSSGSSGDWMSNLLSMSADYNSIRSGAYSKLLKAYYAKDSSSSVKKIASDKTKEIKKTEEEKAIASAKSDADDLKKSADALTTTGSKSLFKEKDIETTDEETGEKVTTKGYDRKAITSAIKSFVKDYNDMIESGSDADNTTILQKTLAMTQITNSNSKLLSKIGITVESGNKLKVDEDKLNEASISTVKTLFNGTGSYASQIAYRASQVSSAAVNASLNSSLYTSGASYNKNYYNSLFDYGA